MRTLRRGGALGGARVGCAAGGRGAGRAFATPRGRGGRSALIPCARRCAAVRAAGSGARLRRCRGRGPFGASLSARPRPRLVAARPRRAPAARAPCSGIRATHSPPAASGGYGTAPPPPPPRQFRRTAPSSDPPRRSGRTAKGKPRAVAADGPRRAAGGAKADRPARTARGTCESVPRSLLARSSLVPRSLRAARAAARSAAEAPQGRPGAKPRTPPRRSWGAVGGYEKTHLVTWR